jgi:hypothetical protein
MGSEDDAVPRNHRGGGLGSLTEHQKQGLLLLVLSAVIYAACQFEATLNFVVSPPLLAANEDSYVDDIEGPKPDTHVAMIALLGERNSGTRWTTEYVVVLFLKD